MYTGKIIMRSESSSKCEDEIQWVRNNYLSALAFIMTHGECIIGEHKYKYVSPSGECYLAIMCENGHDEKYSIYHKLHDEYELYKLTSTEGMESAYLSTINRVEESNIVWYEPESNDRLCAGLELLWTTHNIIEAASFIINVTRTRDKLMYSYTYESAQNNTFELRVSDTDPDTYVLYYKSPSIILELGTVSVSDISIYKAQWYSCPNSQISIVKSGNTVYYSIPDVTSEQ